MGDSAIEWTDKTWNPVVGCEWASRGCDGCYAARDAFGRLAHTNVYAGLAHKRTPDELPRFTGELRMIPDRLEQPSRWRRPCRVFVNSMSDLFHPAVLKMTHSAKRYGAGATWPYLAIVFAEMIAAERHTFQILTKRPAVMAAVLREPRFRLDVNAILLSLGHEVMPGGMTDPGFVWPSNLWLGTSVEDEASAYRIGKLLQVPAAVRFLSIEPLLGPVDLAPWILCGERDGEYGTCNMPRGHEGRWHQETRDGEVWAQWGGWKNPEPEGRIDWVIVGGESGPRARPMHPEWARTIRDQCFMAGVPFHFKQWGEWHDSPPGRATHVLFPDGEFGARLGRPLAELEGAALLERVGKRTAGRVLDGRTWDDDPLTVAAANA